MVDAVVSYAVNKLGDFLILKVVQRQKINDDMEWMKTELGYMKALVKVAEQNETMDPRLNEWVSEISNLAQDIVDILDAFTSKVYRETSNNGIVDRVKKYACICKQEANLNDIGNKIESLRRRVDDLSRKKDTYGITTIANPAGEGTSSSGPVNITNTQIWRRTTSYVEKEHFVGFEDAKEMLLKEVHKHEERRSVISIYGMGGLGKTTLARELYDSANFSCRAWVCVSQEYSIQDLLRTVIKSFKTGCDRDELERMDMDDLERHLREFLNEKKYLVVVDDVWHKEAWESLKRAFPDHRNGSRVIITTRKKEVAERVDERSFVHQLRFLSSEESWNLFSKKISHTFSPEMQETGKEIVEKCGGLPLAIVVLGGLLAHEKDHQQWRKVKDQLWQNMKEDSIDISHLFSLSYNDLSSELKQCFLYIGIFPEDHNININNLFQLWMAEGLILEVNDMEDIAAKYLHELIGRGLIIMINRDYIKIHDLLREIVVGKAREKRLLDIYDPRVSTGAHSSPRRLAIHSKIENFFSADISGEKLRSLIFFNPDNEELDIGFLNNIICKRFNCFCVLDLGSVIFGNSKKVCIVPDAIGGLIHLKLLNLRFKNITQLHIPSSIGNLKSLQTLRIESGYDGSIRLPKEICKLINLRHLYVQNLEGHVNMNTLTNLRSLYGVSYNQWTCIDTTILVNLREVSIKEFSPIKDRPYILDSFTNLKNLTTLSLSLFEESVSSLEPLFSCPNLQDLDLDGKIEKLPPFNKFPPSLTYLRLVHSRLSEDPMPTLEKLLNLRELRLDGAYDGKEFTCSNNGFLQLEQLLLWGLPNLENWNLADTSMPAIRRLMIKRCPKLMIIPERLNLKFRFNPC